ncbi:TetR/AcrR family transcriptional regulator [Streptomyces inhibens]|nr:TetR/AcrR family transcriptional regulator [Streptomyces inhibens]
MPKEVWRKTVSSQSAPHLSRREILEAGARVFVDVDYDEATMTDISRSAGVSEEKLREVFETKEGFAEALLEQSVVDISMVVARDPEPVILQELLNAGNALVTRSDDVLQQASARLTLEGANGHSNSWNGLRYWVQYVEGILLRSLKNGELMGRCTEVRTVAESIVSSFAGLRLISLASAGDVSLLGSRMPTLFKTILPSITPPGTLERLRWRPAGASGTTALAGLTGYPASRTAQPASWHHPQRR